MKKKALILLLSCVVSASLAACGGAKSEPEKTDVSTVSEETAEETDPDQDEEVEEAEDIVEEPDEEAPAESADDIESQIEVKAVPSKDGHTCVFVTNHSDSVIDDLEVQVNYLDKDGNIIDLDEDGHDMILPGYTVVSRMDAPDEYDTMETSFDVELGCNPSYENHSNVCEVKANNGDGCIIVQITNNSEVDIDEAEYIVVYYKGDEIASVSHFEDVYDLKSGDTAVEKDSYYKVDFDRAEVYLNQAHTFDTELKTKTDVTADPVTVFPVVVE